MWSIQSSPVATAPSETITIISPSESSSSVTEKSTCGSIPAGSDGVSTRYISPCLRINVSAALKKNAAVSFSVDKTAPLCIPLNISENSAYKGESHTAKLCISDNVALKEVKVYVNGDPAPTRIDNDEYSFEIYNSPHAQEISVVLTDMADNEIEYNYRNILVTTSVLRLLIRKTWFKIAGIAALLLAGAATFFIRRRRRLR